MALLNIMIWIVALMALGFYLIGVFNEEKILNNKEWKDWNNGILGFLIGLFFLLTTIGFVISYNNIFLFF